MEHTIITDVDKLIKIRFDFISEETELSAADRKRLEPQLREYFSTHIQSGDFVAYAIEIEGDIASVAFLTISERPASLSFPNGRVGTVMNVLTYPKFRRKGYAAAVINDLIVDSDMQSVHILDLFATDMGGRLYEKLGFGEIPYRAMRLKMQ